jgi:hypothetical protein
VEVAAGEIGTVNRVTIANVLGELQLTAKINNGGTVFHAIRHANGTWTALSTLPNGELGRDVSNAGVQGVLHFVSITFSPFSPGGNVRHRIRNADGSWTGIGDVNAAAGNSPGLCTSIADTTSLTF